MIPLAVLLIPLRSLTFPIKRADWQLMPFQGAQGALQTSTGISRAMLFEWKTP